MLARPREAATDLTPCTTTMRRWNGWGDDATTVELPEAARALLAAAIGEPEPPPPDLARVEALRRLPASRMPAHAMIATGADVRLRYAHGQGFPDLVALRTGEGLDAPDGVARPSTDGEVRELLAFARDRGVAVVPRGGGTSVVGHFAARGDAPVLALSLERMAALEGVDAASRLATVGAGAMGPALEAALREHGLTLGHFPQSFERSTLGGWIATRSSGQQSLGFGRIEDTFAGGTVVAPHDTLELQPWAASAAGPDLRQLVLGSEGRLGVITRATVRVVPVPTVERFVGVFFPAWPAAMDATRALAQEGVPLSMVRTSTPEETATSLTLAGHERAIRMLRRVVRMRGLLRFRRLGEAPCLMLIGASGTRRLVRRALGDAMRIVRRFKGIPAGGALGEGWRKGRFRAPYLRDVLWEMGYGVDTVETAAAWRDVPRVRAAVEDALGEALWEQGERVHRFTHLSHVYASGASVYTTFVFRRAAAPDETLARWRALKRAASEAIVRHGGTISHQHGVGTYHLPWMAAEKGAAGVRVVDGALRALDPDGVMNPGVLIPGEGGRHVDQRMA